MRKPKRLQRANFFKGAKIMNRTMITAANTMSQLQLHIDTIANNIANLDTNGFKRRDVAFTELIYQHFNNQTRPEREIGRLSPDGIRQGTGARMAASRLVMAQGAIKPTDRALDTAFTKEGQLFKVLVQQPGGEAGEICYTRNGALYLSPAAENESVLVNGDGYFILDENNQPIIIAGDVERIAINETGELRATMTDGTEQTYLLGVVQVNNPQFLEARGQNLYGLPAQLDELGVAAADILTELSGALRGEIGIRQMALEQSNVDLAKEMTDLMNVQRTYQFQARTISLADQMMGIINGMR